MILQINLPNFFVIPPLQLYIDVNSNNKPGMKGAPLEIPFPEIYNYFANGSATKETIERNKNNFIVSINGMSPIDFVLNFGSEYYNYMKNKDARYTRASTAFSDSPLIYFFPMLEKDFTRFTVVYSNGESFVSDFYFMNLDAIETKERSDIGSLKEFAWEMIKNNPERNVIGLGDILKAYNNGEKPKEMKPMTDIDTIQALKNFDFEKIKTQVKVNTRAVATTASGITWDFTTSDGKLMCRVDDKNKVDVFFIKSFNVEQKAFDEFVSTLEHCMDTFDGNEYPIVVINDKNEGGAVALSFIFQEMLQLDMTARSFVSYKNDERVHKLIKTLVEGGGLQNPATGTIFTTVEGLMEDAEVDDYGNGVSHSRSKPALFLYSAIRYYMDKIKPTLKRNRKPTDIIVFTDSYSFSAGAIFTKGLKEAGAAIIVGYNGYPGSKKESFDIGQAPTNNFRDGLDILGKEEYNRLFEKGIIFRTISAGESYRLSDVENGVKPLVPREFLFDAADERVAIYNAYNESKYDTFIEAAKGVFEKYKTQCNPDNLGLHMRTVLCDEKINKTHMHGGYVCGADGKWTTQCEGYYCDIGYYFDTKTKECVVDPFYSTDSSNTITISIWALLLVLTFILF